MVQKSVTVDEMVYITAGYQHLVTGEFDYNRTNPPLAKLVSALPLVLLDLELPDADGDPRAWTEIDQWHYGRAFLYENVASADTILGLARLPILIAGLLLGLYLYGFTRREFGQAAALCALTFYVFSPNLIAHSRLGTQDFLLSALVFVAATTFWRLIERPSLRLALLSGGAVALSAATKTTAVFLVPILALVLLIRVAGDSDAMRWAAIPTLGRLRSRRLQQVLSVVVLIATYGLLTLLVLNAAYFFEGSGQPLSAYVPTDRLAGRLPEVLVPLASWPLPLPEGLIDLMRFQMGRVSGGHQIYFLGRLSNEGWWYMMPAAFLMKTPIAFQVAAATGIWASLRKKPFASSFASVALIAIGVYLAGFSYLSSISVGIRYILPIYPFLCVLAGTGIAALLSSRRVIFVAAGASLLVWHAASALFIYPHYLAYFNEAVGGPANGYKYLVDSYLDWGQDLPGLREYMDEQQLENINLGYFGSGDPSHYGIKYRSMPSVGLAPARDGAQWWYDRPESDYPELQYPIAVSATLLGGVFVGDFYSELRHREPDAQIGYSILVFNEPQRTKDAP
ncbi:glycosyltransferase family 39 protein [Deltaproteobacteria bacterium]|nr:glycosyltransferase family 39 protein [Deltaproteobacteria bacterium]